MASLNIKKGDNVMIITGEDAGKKGKVLKVLTDEQRVVVEGRNKVIKHQRPRNQRDAGGIVEREASIHVSNVMVVCPKCGKATKTGIKFVEGKGKKVRVCKQCGAEIPTVDDAK
ncbi:MAG: 50S ribosomal protein L24 [Clostridia bacterium]|nr:50S ribosomal protein L24 [Clostridia bacterium]MCR5694430.1 50S ribosomal protein L24 [Clostridia bacterium]